MRRVNAGGCIDTQTTPLQTKLQGAAPCHRPCCGAQASAVGCTAANAASLFMLQGRPGDAAGRAVHREGRHVSCFKCLGRLDIMMPAPDVRTAAAPCVAFAICRSTRPALGGRLCAHPSLLPLQLRLRRGALGKLQALQWIVGCFWWLTWRRLCISVQSVRVVRAACMQPLDQAPPLHAPRPPSAGDLHGPDPCARAAKGCARPRGVPR